ncbi:hypothetical protein AAKU67_002325 [Oxalobacteraceae bacterium GrIS 2.11]
MLLIAVFGPETISQSRGLKTTLVNTRSHYNLHVVSTSNQRMIFQSKQYFLVMINNLKIPYIICEYLDFQIRPCK